MFSRMDRLKFLITNRKRFLLHDGERYRTISGGTKINNIMLQQHLDGEISLGVFPDGEESNFLAFDIDTKKIEVLDSIVVILECLGLRYHLFESGEKGYHIWLVFEQPIKRSLLDRLFDIVVFESNTLGLEDKIEKRGGTNNNGIRLPYGIHPKTKKNMTQLERVGDFLFIPTDDVDDWKKNTYDDVKEIISIFEVMPEEVLESFEKGNEYDITIEYYEEILRKNSLVQKGSRNRVTFLLAIYLKDLGYSENETFDRINDVLSNTPEHLFNDKTTSKTKEYWLKKTIENVFTKNMSFVEKKINKVDIARILSLRNLNAIKIAFQFYVRSLKSKQQTFYLSRNTISELTGISLSTMKPHIKKLQEEDIIVKVTQGGLTKTGVKLANYWKYNHVRYTTEYIVMPVYELNLMHIVRSLFDEREVRDLVGNSCYYKNFHKFMNKSDGVSKVYYVGR